MKKLWQNKIFKNFVLLFFNLFLLEVIFRLVSSATVFDWSLFRIFLGDIFISLLLGYLFSFLPKLLNKILNILIVFIACIYALAQMGFVNFIGVYTSVQSRSQLRAVLDYIWDFLKSYKWYYFLVLISFILILLYYIFFDKKVSIDMPKKKRKLKVVVRQLMPVVILAIVGGIYYWTLTADFMQNKLQSVTNHDLFIKPVVPSTVVNQFGIVGFGILDVREAIWPGSVDEVEFDYTIYTTEEVTDYTREIDDTAWVELIEEEEDTTLNNLNKYFISQTITDKNDYTGLFEGKNLIVIMIETGSNVLINEEEYPNFYKLYSEGWHWENNYSPINTCSTGNNEFSALSSLYSINNNCTANVYKDNTYFEAIFNLFNNKGYNTVSMHDYTEYYYYRGTIHPNMGVSKYYGVEDLGIDYSTTYGVWPSDVEFIEKYLDILDTWDEDTPFMSWLTTVTSHQPYTYYSDYGEVYKSYFTKQGYSVSLARYMSKLKVVDEAIGVLLEGLEERGILDDTVIVLFGDHYAYGLDEEVLNEVLDFDNTVDKEAERVPFIIYSTDIESATYSEYTSYVNILPTLANLFDLDYDPRLYMGSDLLSDDYESLVIFSDGSWRNDIAYYNAGDGTITYYAEVYDEDEVNYSTTDQDGKSTYTDEEIQEINTTVRYKLDMSADAIENNYFAYLEEKLGISTKESDEDE